MYTEYKDEWWLKNHLGLFKLIALCKYGDLKIISGGRFYL